jgi:hypothetical protein
MKKIICTLIIYLLSISVFAQTSIDELTRHIDKGDEQITVQVKALEQSFNDMFVFMGEQTSRTMLSSLGSIIICFFIFFFFYIRSRKSYLKKTEELLNANQKMFLQQMTAQNTQFLKAINQIVKENIQVSLTGELVSMDRHINDAFPTIAASPDYNTNDDRTMFDSDIPLLPQTIVRGFDRKKRPFTSEGSQVNMPIQQTYHRDTKKRRKRRLSEMSPEVSVNNEQQIRSDPTFIPIQKPPKKKFSEKLINLFKIKSKNKKSQVQPVNLYPEQKVEISEYDEEIEAIESINPNIPEQKPIVPEQKQIVPEQKQIVPEQKQIIQEQKPIIKEADIPEQVNKNGIEQSKRPRGRPRKYPIINPDENQVKRSRGRPRKYPLEQSDQKSSPEKPAEIIGSEPNKPVDSMKSGPFQLKKKPSLGDMVTAKQPFPPKSMGMRSQAEIKKPVETKVQQDIPKSPEQIKPQDQSKIKATGGKLYKLATWKPFAKKNGNN